MLARCGFHSCKHSRFIDLSALKHHSVHTVFVPGRVGYGRREEFLIKASIGFRGVWGIFRLLNFCMRLRWNNSENNSIQSKEKGKEKSQSFERRAIAKHQPCCGIMKEWQCVWKKKNEDKNENKIHRSIPFCTRGIAVQRIKTEHSLSASFVPP